MTEPLRCASVDVARARVLASLAPLPAVDLPVADAYGTCLAQPITAPGPMPPFDNAAMDGWAVTASSVDVALPSGAVPIATGQRIPPGCDAVVPLERVDRSRHVAGTVRPGDHIRRRGEEFRAGAELLQAGDPMTAPSIGLLAGCGMERVTVHRRPRVAVLVTGDELHSVARRAADELIHDANGPMLGALVVEAGGALLPVEHAADDVDGLRAALQRLAASADLLLTSGGASVGRPDHLLRLLGELGSVELRELAVKPGRPTSYGRIGNVPVVVLPGNPFALLAGFELLARPALRRLAGDGQPLRPRVALTTAQRFHADASRLSVVPVRLQRSLAHALEASGAAMLSGAARADGLAFVAPGRPVEAGDDVEVELWRR